MDRPGLRPTPDRIRETLFNWLQGQIVGARCLDLFAGTGALAFEALSRGAEWAVLIEPDPLVRAHLEASQRALHARAFVYAGRFPDQLPLLQEGPFDLVFLDPPFKQGLLAPALEWLIQNNLLSAKASIYVECEPELEFVCPVGWEIYRWIKRRGGLLTRR
ncbi:MAG: 16S rRNA (guanine(966)-N(2))-methyltransferase RsmD [Gammaproteobacteria bacterium RIFCSPHIGHO2_12_FULL_45_9]|nr:MAG: 16S rRNA (guanine(966)-N(2))-methyltransferase RsmD [Gammaproteobacteria bacterium RIFCSPHIGHO2_12_FULL_45_9]